MQIFQFKVWYKSKFKHGGKQNTVYPYSETEFIEAGSKAGAVKKLKKKIDDRKDYNFDPFIKYEVIENEEKQKPAKKQTKRTAGDSKRRSPKRSTKLDKAVQ